MPLLTVVALVGCSAAPDLTRSREACELFYELPGDPGPGQLRRLIDAAEDAESPLVQFAGEETDWRLRAATLTAAATGVPNIGRPALQVAFDTFGDACEELDSEPDEAFSKMCARVWRWVDDEGSRDSDLAIKIHNAAFLSGDDLASEHAEAFSTGVKAEEEDDVRQYSDETINPLIELEDHCTERGHPEPS